jgi:hypothetical protein
VAHGFRALIGELEGSNKEDFAKNLLKAAPSLVSARVCYDYDSTPAAEGSIVLVRLSSAKWEVESESALPGFTCSEEELEIIREYHPLESSDFPPELENRWDVD